MATDDSTQTRTDMEGAVDRAPHVLVVADGSSRRVALPATGDVVIGRAPDVELHVEDESASRRHATLTTRDGEVTVTDLDSHNGTRVNGERLTGVRRLAPGDVVQIGGVVIIVYGGAAPAVREMFDGERLRRRIDDEIERAAAFDRELGVILLAGDQLSGARVLAADLRAIDLVAEVGKHVAILAPEHDRDAVATLAESVVAKLGPSARAGFATCPDDCADADALLAAARAALETATPGTVVDAGAVVGKLALGDRTMLVADPAMTRLVALATRLAKSELAVLVRGETGTGKEHLARALHYLGPRATQPFVTLNCAAIQDTLVESELFGHEKGAFSGAVTAKPGLLEVADRGTVFLDEVGELSAAMQAKLLRALETKRITRVGAVTEREVDIRVVAATHRDLEAEAAAGRFRRDLYFRLGGATIALPPLRDRPREIALLARAFLDDACTRANRSPLRISAGAMRALTRYAWPGNVRELRNLIDYAAATVEDATLEVWQLPQRVVGDDKPKDEAAPAAPHGFRAIAEELRELERRRMRESVAATGGVLKHAAALIGMPLRTFHLKAKQYGLTGKG